MAKPTGTTIDLGQLQADFIAKKKASLAADKAAIRALDAQEAAKAAYEQAKQLLSNASRAVVN